MEKFKIKAQLAAQGLEVGRYYRLISIDESAATFEEVVIETPLIRESGLQEIGRLLVDWDRSRVQREGTWHKLSPLMLRLFRVLASSPGQTFSYRAITTYVWDQDAQKTSLTVLTKRLRSAVGDEMIETMKPTGLRLAI